MRNAVTTLVCSLAVGAALVQPNSATAQEEQASAQANLTKSISEISTETLATRDQLQKAIGTLDALTKQQSGDLKPAYDAFVTEVANTHAAADKTGSRVSDMQGASHTYFSGWQKEISGISNESLRKQAQKRLDAVRRDYGKAVDSLGEAAKRFKPLLSDLDDVQKMLANDITPAGVKSVRGVAKDSYHAADKVRSSILNAITKLQSMQNALSSKSS